MWIFILVSILMFDTSSSTLTGENVCQKKETFKENVTHYVLRNVTVRTYVWCYRFPPRCTNFSSKQVNDTEIREEDRVRYKNVCCAGYVPNEEGNSCVAISQCAVNCVNGICDAESKCYCNPGYRGDDCSKACIAQRWGRYCRYHCNCVRGTCNSSTGHCSCPAGWSGTRCMDACSKGSYGVNCTSICDCPSNECNPIDGQCIYNPINQLSKQKNTINIDNGLRRLVEDISRKLPRNDSTRTAVLQKYHTFNIKVLNDTESKLNDIKITTNVGLKLNEALNQNGSGSRLTEIPSTQGSTEERTWKAHENFHLNLETVESNDKKIIIMGDNTTEDIYNKSSSPDSTQINTENPSVYWKPNKNFVLTLERGSSNTKSNVVKDNVTEGTPKLLRMKVLKSYDEDDDDITSVRKMQPREEAYFDNVEVHKSKSTRSGHIFFTIGGIAVSSLLLIGILSLVLAIRRFKRISPTNIDDDDKEENIIIDNKNSNSTAMTVTARSIFHTPLPDPPVINNPVFTTPIENSSTFETHVICSVNISKVSPLKKEIPETAEIFYDHPPSTSSYQAAVEVPEPPDKDRSVCVCAIEPVYDEIPCWKLSEVECNQIYQNENAGFYANSISRKANQYKNK